MNTAAKGARAEHRSIRILEAAGYACIRSSNSRSPWDVLALAGHELLLVQVKTRDWPSLAEMAQLRAFPAPPGARKLVHRWGPGRHEPDVREVL